MKLSRISTGGEEKWLGPEPSWTNQSEWTPEQLRDAEIGALNWYSYFTDKKNYKNFLLEYMQGIGQSKDEISLIRGLSDSEVTPTVGKIARMMSIGYSPSENFKQKFTKQFAELLSRAKQNEQNKNSVASSAVDTPIVPSIQDRIRDKANEEIGELEGMVDDFVMNKCKLTIDIENYLKGRNLSSVVAKKICDHYVSVSEEVMDAINGVDEQLVEGYSNFKKPELKRFKDFLDSIVIVANNLSDANKPVRKKRKVKEKPASVLVSKVKYMKDFAELGLTSVPPEKMIGALQVWTFNTKTRMLSVYNTYNAKGLSIKGTTLQNFEETTSISKRLRKPEVTLKDVLGGGKIILRKLMSELSTKESPVTGRINEDTIIVRVS
jgi:hypothetical protein